MLCYEAQIRPSGRVNAGIMKTVIISVSQAKTKVLLAGSNLAM
jgi:predicted PP-loop superfamily ATPase